MPKEGEMTQLSRPFQIALAAVVLFALVWFVGVRRPGSTASSAASSPTRPVTAHAVVHTRSTAATSRSTHGLSRTESSAVSAAQTAAHGGAPSAQGGVSRAHGGASGTPAATPAAHPAAAHAHTTASTHTSVRAVHATHSDAGSAQHSTTAVRTHTSVAIRHRSGTSAAATGTASSGASHRAAVDPRRTQPARRGPAAAATSPAAPARQAAVAAELKQGKVVLILFWDSHSSADAAVHGQVLAAAHKLGHSVAVQSATAEQVGDFGSITRDIQVYQTPTLLIVNPQGQVTTVTGYTDAYAIEQTVREARG
jgi:hypothetical protein